MKKRAKAVRPRANVVPINHEGIGDNVKRQRRPKKVVVKRRKGGKEKRWLSSGVVGGRGFSIKEHVRGGCGDGV